MSFLNRLNRELETFGKKAQAALDEGKVQLELVRVRRQRDAVARDLGLLVHRRERTGEAEPRRIDALMARIDELEQEIARLQREVAAERGEAVSVNTEPMPTRGEATPPQPTETAGEMGGPADPGPVS